MERITVSLDERSYPISIGAGLFNDPALLSLSAKQKVLIITNHTVAPLYAGKITALLDQKGCQSAVLETAGWRAIQKPRYLQYRYELSA